jgi:beta-galactosidase
VTRNHFGSGTAWYVSTKLDGGDLAAVVRDAVENAGIEAAPRPPEGLEVATRSAGTDTFTFLINHADTDAEYPATGTDLLSGKTVIGTAVVPAGNISVIHTTKVSAW